MASATACDTSVDSPALRDIYGEVHPLAVRKVLDRLDPHTRRFIGLSPFLVIGTSDAQGRQDVSPRGDAPGFVRILDDRTLLLPDRPGNNRVDSLGNVAQQPQVAMIFFIPGVDETLRINGRGSITTDRALLEPSVVNGKLPVSGLVVELQECFMHCAKALIRSHLWDPTRKIPRNSFPSLARIITDQIAGVEIDQAEAAVDDSYKNTLY